MSDTPLEVFEIPAQGAERGSVIWMHGLGASNHDFDDVIPLLELADVRFVFPGAPVLPVTINGGMAMPAWYDILSFEDPPLREDETTVRQSAKLVNELIDREVARGVPEGRIVLMGFSQGGAMALHVGLRRGGPSDARSASPSSAAPSSNGSGPLLGIAALSAYLVLPQHFEAELNPASRSVPVLFCHGTADDVVPLALAKAAHAAVQAANIPTEFHSFPMQHAMCLPEIYVLKRWLHQRFAG